MPNQLYATTRDGIQLPAHVDDHGVTRLLGCTPVPDRLKARFLDLESAGIPLIPRQQWKPFNRRRREIPMLDQLRHGSCVGNGSTKALMYARANAGSSFQLLSPTSLYAQINGGRDGGANISDAMEALTKTGVCLMSQFGEDSIYERDMTPEAKATRERFKALDCYALENWDQVCTAAQLGLPISLSVYVWGSWNLDADGCPPVYRGTGNHCVFMGSEMRQARNGEWLLGGDNSWGTTWGDHGEFAIREGHLANQGGFDAFAIRAAASDPLDPTNPAKVVAA